MEKERKPLLSAELWERASRTIALPGVGAIGQRRISAARVVVIGAGGLGSPVLQYLAAIGVGSIGVVDVDTVDLSNLQRQIIHRMSRVGMLKTESAASMIADLNPDVEVIEHPVLLDRGNSIEIMRDYDIVVDASDNFATRYLVSDSAALLRMPYVWGSVLQFDGQLSVFWERARDGAAVDYRDLHPVPPDPRQVLSCAEGGVLGSLCGTIGSMMATEVIKIITGIGDPLIGRVQTLDALTGEWSTFDVRRSPDRAPVRELIDYEEFCGVRDEVHGGATVSAAELREQLAAGVTLIDVRESDEHEAGHIEGDTLIPLSMLIAEPSRVGDGPVVIYCASGTRSARAVAVLEANAIPAVSLEGGFAAWRSDSLES